MPKIGSKPTAQGNRLLAPSDGVAEAVPPVSPAWRWLFVVATAVFWFSLYLYVPILSPYTQVLGGSLGIVGLVVSSYGLTQLVLRIPTGIWSDRLGRRKPFVIAGFVASALAAAGMGLAPEPISLLIFRGLSGVAATMWVAMTVLYASYLPPERTTQAMGLMNATSSFAQLLATFLGGLVADAWGWRAPFWGATAAAVVGLGLSLAILDRTRRPAQPLAWRELAAAGKEPLLVTASALAALAQYVTFSTVFGFTPVYATSLGASRSELGVLTLIAQIPAALGSLLVSSPLARRVGERWLVVWGLACLAGGTLAVPLCRQIWQLDLTQAVAGLGRGIAFPVLMGLSLRAVTPERKSTAMGYFQSLYSIGMFLGPMLSGFLGDRWGLAALFAVAGGVGLAGAATAAALPILQRMDRPESSARRQAGYRYLSR